MAVEGSYKYSFSADVSAFKGLGSQLAGKFTDEFENGTDGIGSKLGGALSGVGKVAAVGLAAASTAVVGLGAAAMAAQADIQQSMGGSEAVFADNAQMIQEWAAAAAGTMGMSTNAALETANKMGSLYQGAGIDAATAAEMTMNMSQRASDVASVMGVDLASAMDAVAGAAKGNFTMMDNLGVAMNETTLATYAAENGYSKLYSEMSNGEKSQVAYAMFMDRTSQYAGNFAKENTSLAGSMDILKSSWGNVLSSLGDPGMLDSAMTQMSSAITNVFTAVSAVLPSIIGGISTLIADGLPIIMKTIADLIPELVKLISTALPEVITALVTALPGLIDVIITALLDLVPMLLTSIIQIVDAIVKLLPSVITKVIAALVVLLPLILTAAIELLMAIIDALPTIIAAISESMPLLVEAIITALLQALPLLLEAAMMLIGALIEAIFTSIIPAQGATWELMAALLLGIGEFLVSSAAMLGQMALTFFMNIVSALGAIVGPLLAAIGQALWSLITSIVGFFGTIYSTARDMFWGFITGAVGVLSGMWGNIGQFFMNIPGYISDAFAGIGDIGKNLVTGLWNGILNVKDWIISKIAGFGSAVMDGFKDIFNIHSPSRLMRDEVGVFIGQGIGEGIAASTSDVLKDAADFSSRISGGFDISTDVDYGTEGAYAASTQAPSVVVNQTVQQPKDMLDMFLTTKRGANAGLALA